MIPYICFMIQLIAFRTNDKIWYFIDGKIIDNG
jgi:hypothetical protein